MSRLLAAAVLLSSWAAFAAGPKKPAGTIGSAKEDEPCPAAASTSGPDLAVLRGIQWAFEPAPIEVRGQAIEDLGLLGDPRALNPLAVLSLDPNPAVSRAAIRAVGLIRHPRAEEILSNIVRHPSAPLAAKQQALSLVPFQNTPTALRFVHQTSRLPNGPFELLNQARTLAAMLPSPSAEEADRGVIAPAPPPPPPPAPHTAPPLSAGDSK
ncbi:MAG: HEAT repeat domain-containing protein [Myxococcota bacterium]